MTEGYGNVQVGIQEHLNRNLNDITETHGNLGLMRSKRLTTDMNYKKGNQIRTHLILEEEWARRFNNWRYEEREIHTYRNIQWIATSRRRRLWQ